MFSSSKPLDTFTVVVMANHLTLLEFWLDSMFSYVVDFSMASNGPYEMGVHVGTTSRFI